MSPTTNERADVPRSSRHGQVRVLRGRWEVGPIGVGAVVVVAAARGLRLDPRRVRIGGAGDDGEVERPGHADPEAGVRVFFGSSGSSARPGAAASRPFGLLFGGRLLARRGRLPIRECAAADRRACRARRPCTGRSTSPPRARSRLVVRGVEAFDPILKGRRRHVLARHEPSPAALIFAWPRSPSPFVLSVLVVDQDVGQRELAVVGHVDGQRRLGALLLRWACASGPRGRG